MCPGLEDLTELLEQSLPFAPSLRDIRRATRIGTIVPPEQDHHQCGDDRKDQATMDDVCSSLACRKAGCMEQVRVVEPQVKQDHTEDDAEQQGSEDRQQGPTAKEMPWA